MLVYASLRFLDDSLHPLYVRTLSDRAIPARKKEQRSKHQKVLLEFGSVVCATAGAFAKTVLYDKWL